MTWSITYNGVTKTAAQWGVLGLKRTRKCFAADEVTFTMSGQAFDAPATFTQWSLLTFTNPGGVQWFVGLVTKIPVKGSTKEEDQSYTVEGPWRNFEKLVFQEEWMALNNTDVLVPTLRTTTIIGQTATVTEIPLAQMVTLVANYVLALAGTPRFIPFQFNLDPSLSITLPAYTDAEGFPIPAQPMMIPYTEVKDLTCSQLMINFFQWIPDAAAYVDYTTSPPTLNIARRGALTPVTLVATGGPANGSIVADEGIDLTPRADLVVPAVILKYSQNNTINNGKSSITYNTITPDIYPPTAADPAIDNFVVDIDLQPGNATYQSQDIKTVDRPIDYDSIAKTGSPPNISAWAWITDEHRAHWLTQYTIPANWPGGGSPPFPANPTAQDVVVNVPGPWSDSGNTDFTIRRIVTNLVSNYSTPVVPPTNPPSTTNILQLPSGNVPAGGGPGSGTGTSVTIDGVVIPTGSNALDMLVDELISGSVPAWMTKNQNIYVAHVKVSVTIQYTGSDPVVAAWFSSAPTQLLTFDFPVTVTNGETGTYTQLASMTPSEPVPIGLAQIIYEGLSVLLLPQK